MKVKSKKSGRLFSDRFAATAIKIGIGQEIGNSANLIARKPKATTNVVKKPKVKKPKATK